MRHRGDDTGGGGTTPSHTVYLQRRVYTDARGNFYDVPTGASSCTCSFGSDHHEVSEREPFVPDER